MSAQRFPSAAAAVASAFVAISLAFMPFAAHGAPPQTGLAYDEVTKVVIGGDAPEPGSFSADFTAAVNAQKSATAPGTHHGIFGGIMNTVDLAKNAVGFLKSGTASSEFYLAGWERTEDPATQTATIIKPQLHQIIYLNLAKKTYRVVDPTAHAVNETPPPMDRARPAAGPPTQPGSGKLDITVTNTALGEKVIDNVPTTGYKLVFNLTESQSTGSCSDGTFQTTMIEYVSRYAEPHAAVLHTAIARPMNPMNTRPELMALKPGCAPAMTVHHSGTAQPASGHLALWTLITISAGAPSAQGEMRGGFSTLIERGNVRSLSAADKGLFSTPADFTAEPVTTTTDTHSG